jgi:hypothetical protein
VSFALLVVASLAAAEVEERPTVAYDLGLVTARGRASSTYDDPNRLNSWVRAGPELVASVFAADWLTLGVGFGYQAGWYSVGDEVVRRHVYSIRVTPRIRFLERGAWVHGISFGLIVVISRAATESTLYDLDDPHRRVDRKDAHGGLYLAYSPSMHIAKNWLVSAELGVCGFAVDQGGEYEIILRPGVAYEF